MYEFTNNEPIYIQLMRLIQSEIVSGNLAKGDKIHSVRELAVEYGINPNTVQKALTELERKGYIYTDRTNGRYVSMEETEIAAIRQKKAEQLADAFVHELMQMKYDETDVVRLCREAWQRKGDA